MVIKTERIDLIPAGKQRGLISGCVIEDRTFGFGCNPEKKLVITITPRQPRADVPDDERLFPDIEVLANPKVNPMSAIGKMLKRFGMEPNWGKEDWEETSVINLDVTFIVTHDNQNGTFFPRVAIDSINLDKPKPPTA